MCTMQGQSTPEILILEIVSEKANQEFVWWGEPLSLLWLQPKPARFLSPESATMQAADLEIWSAGRMVLLSVHILLRQWRAAYHSEVLPRIINEISIYISLPALSLRCFLKFLVQMEFLQILVHKLWYLRQGSVFLSFVWLFFFILF